MTKDEMLDLYYPLKECNNYKEAQERIKKAMKEGKKYILLPKDFPDFSWYATYDTIEQLREDGFKINEVWDPYEYWSVEWGYDYE